MQPLWPCPRLANGLLQDKVKGNAERSIAEVGAKVPRGRKLRTRGGKPGRAYPGFLLYCIQCWQVCISPSEAENSLGVTGTSLV